ncbi:hypothetical protein FSO04_18850 [Paraburkholderia madseniana]|uniref:Uncharacterized protein n=1 Tax=Paraburkholderia madseniana TaxID=2599607 RepID=A0A6N6WCU8_9BURK|nr:hypothetical protein [Paraburkholderia madseniana]KAE8758445.1 hypothetical protein FSO04_18850 [Paraburkholderia madseniana]
MKGREQVEFLEQQTASNVDGVARIGARVVVMSQLLDAALPRLTPLQRVDVEQAFRDGIEEAMAYVDDIAMPEQYHSTLLELTNQYLVVLSADRQDAR